MLQISGVGVKGWGDAAGSIGGLESDWMFGRHCRPHRRCIPSWSPGQRPGYAVLTDQSPEGALESSPVRRSSAVSGLGFGGGDYPGRCPGLRLLLHLRCVRRGRQSHLCIPEALARSSSFLAARCARCTRLLRKSRGFARGVRTKPLFFAARSARWARLPRRFRCFLQGFATDLCLSLARPSLGAQCPLRFGRHLSRRERR